MVAGVGDRLTPTVTFPLAEGPPLNANAFSMMFPRIVYTPAGNIVKPVAVSESRVGAE
jgi:hypothetical protein